MRRYTGHTLAKMLVTAATGIVTGCFAVALTKACGALTGWKLDVLRSSHANDAPARTLVSFLWFWFIGSCLVTLATALVGMRCLTLDVWAPLRAPAHTRSPLMDIGAILGSRIRWRWCYARYGLFERQPRAEPVAIQHAH